MHNVMESSRESPHFYRRRRLFTIDAIFILMSFQIWLIVKDSVVVTDHVIYCRSWPPQGQLPECFNTDMSSSKVFSTNSTVYPHIFLYHSGECSIRGFEGCTCK